MNLKLFDPETTSVPPSPVISHVAMAQQSALLVAARATPAVVDKATLEHAVGVARDIRTHVRSVEMAGKLFREPHRDFIASVMSFEHGYTDPLVEQQERLEKMAMTFQRQEQERADAQERQRLADASRLEKERVKLALEAEALATGMGNEQQLAEALEKASQATLAAAQVAHAVAVQVAPPARGAGFSVRREMCWSCVSVEALYESNPALCNLEPKPSAIKAVVIPSEGATKLDPDRRVPGLECWWEMKGSARTR